MRVGLAQINAIIGDLEGNIGRCLSAIETAQKDKPDLIVLPEMAIPGYLPRDILYDTGFVAAVAEANAELARRAKGSAPVVVGSFVFSGESQPGHPGLYNVALIMEDGEITHTIGKQLLPIYDVFYEPRWFLPAPPSKPIQIAGRSVGFIICEDMWDEGYDLHPAIDLRKAGADLIVCISASPYRKRVIDNRLYHARRQGGAMVYLNLFGGNDEVIFNGQSFILDDAGEVTAMLPAFAETVQVIEIDDLPPHKVDVPPVEEELFQAITLGIRDFSEKNRQTHLFVGLSGGIDSALVAVLASEAMGSENVTAIAIPSRYTDPRSTSCAKELAENLGIGFEIVELDSLHQAAEATLGDLLETGTTAENVQARLRAMILMGFVNSRGGLLLNTSNKTESALGYATLYGDMAGGLCPIADLTKPDVVAISRWINRNEEVIPNYILDRPPSAELKPDQVDPFDYEVISPQLEELVQSNRSNPAIRASEHKRWQMGVVLKVSEKAFGIGRMIPITRR